ncbi:glutamyl-tRNA reductase [Antricoccus suffuscus]|uniref:Glutamyl-tRNA reductase n=1 Tax=Antricoccus suffuscus TaxID=1629062 RepID=A0A2T0ZS09_9ACTN|nr:glutamyl-tRNA reductase [Antricoccus suffuscus]PRZ39074.1 glutamyl-tRNA reductase [Antricoccus suffuscus]
MSFLIVGLTHKQTPVDLLENASVTPSQLDEELTALLTPESVNEAMILSTCNRVEVYADVDKFHGGLDAVIEWLAGHMTLTAADLVPYVQVYYAEEAVEHALRVASGLDSLVVGEPQILGQLRTAYLEATDRKSVGRQLHALSQHALKVGKRIQTELGLSAVGRNIASVAVDLAAHDIGDLTGKRAVVLGAGAMATLAAYSLQRKGIEDITIINRSQDRAAQLAGKVGGTTAPIDDLADRLGDADVLVTALGSSRASVHAATVGTTRAKPLTVVDLALPKNVADEAIALPEVSYIGLTQIQQRAAELNVAIDGGKADVLVNDEVANFLAKQRSAAVTPTIAALRAKAGEVVESELKRLKSRIPDVDDRAMGEIEYAISRIVDKIMHTPSVRVREVAGTPSGDAYAEALRALFDLPESLRNLGDAVDPEVRSSAARLRTITVE